MKQKTFYLIANWKMALHPNEERQFLKKLPCVLSLLPKHIKAVICPSFLSLPIAAEIRKRSHGAFSIGAQNCHWEIKGAYTGEISPAALKKIECSYVLTGHSERRTINMESDDIVRKKIVAIYKSGMTPVLCIGETHNERHTNKVFDRIRLQLISALRGIAIPKQRKIIIAYEPVWAIGSGKPLEVVNIAATSDFIRAIVKKLHPAAACSVLYGGSVDDTISAMLVRSYACDGVLVGSASQSQKSFLRIIRTLSK